jgi:chromate transporter
MRSRLVEIGGLFLKIGTIGFGGPAAFYAMMEDETVQRRGWLTRQHFVDLLGATNLIPGPNAAEMAMHIGYVRGGARGLLVAGLGFILPAALVTTAFAWLYVQHGQRPEIAPVIAGIKPAVLAIIFTAGWRLGKKAINGWIVGFVAAAVAVASMCGVGAVPALLCASLIGTTWLLLARRSDAGGGKSTGRILAAAAAGGSAAGAARVAYAAPLAPLAAATAATGSTILLLKLLKIGLFFLKVGAVLYGTGYVLVAYLKGGLVDQYGWLTENQLMDAVAIGQFTPGPIVCTATFIGYIVMAGDGNHVFGLAGAAVATVGIFLPSFVLVVITNPIIPKLRKYRWTAAFLDAVNAASMGLMAAVTITLAWLVFFPQGDLLSPSWQAIVIGVLASVALLRWRIGAVWLVLGGAAAGALFWLVGWGL